ncbi:MAG: NAD(P)H-hydrate dehydratase [bacterium]
MKISNVEKMRWLDKTAIEKFCIKDELLMENAGGAAFRVLSENFKINGTSFTVLCGSGNNGGDGLVVARKIYSLGGLPHVVLLGDPQKFKGAAATNYKIALKIGFPMEQVDNTEILMDILSASDVVVDAIFGTGLEREVKGFYKDAIESINNSNLPVLAIDIPSGVNGNNGQIMGIAVEADFTVSFGLPKLGNILYPGHIIGGELFVTHLSFPPALTASDTIKTEINEPLPLPIRQEDGHKTSFGDVLFISGAAGYLGAPYFSTMSFLKSGGGYARLAAPSSIVNALGSGGSEIVFVPQKETAYGSLAKNNFSELLELSQKVDFVVIGPGLSLEKETRELTKELIINIDKPILIDGDGITAVCQHPETCRKRNAPAIITPHPGEMSRLSNKSISDIKNSPVDILQTEAEKWNSVIVLKGAHTLIGMPEGQVFINLSGNSGMASAGSGDVLTGTIAAMYGLGLNVNEAVKAGVFLHGFAGDLAAAEVGEDGITAEDIMQFLPDAVLLYREEYEDIREDFYGKITVI